MDFGRAFTFVSEDKDWIIKIVIGAVLPFVPFLILPVLGYQVAIVRNVIHDEEYPLPAWENFGKLFLDGLKLAVGIAVYALPIILLVICASVAIAVAASSGDEFAGGIVAATVAFSCFVIIWSLVITFLVPAMTIRFAETGELGAILQVGRIFAITREHLVDVILVALMVYVARFVLIIVSMIPCIGFIILIAGNTWLMYSTGHLYGQIGRKMGLETPTLPKTDLKPA